MLFFNTKAPGFNRISSNINSSVYSIPYTAPQKYFTFPNDNTKNILIIRHFSQEGDILNDNKIKIKEPSAILLNIEKNRAN